MKIDGFNRVILTESEAITALYANGALSFENIYLEDSTLIDGFNQAIEENADRFPKLNKIPSTNYSLEEFDKLNQNNWFMPAEYQSFDIESWLKDQCRSVTEINRVQEELELYTSYQLLDLLRYLKYLVDVLRDNNIVWGVGRGSSVCSFILYLVGINKINPLVYNLSINEFLK